MAIEHKDIPDSGLHKLKGVATAASGSVPTADGAGGFTWSTTPVTSTFQRTYDNSSPPSINTTAEKGPIIIKANLASNANSVLKFLNNNDVEVLDIDGNGLITLNSIDIKNRLLNSLCTGLLYGGDVTVYDTTSVNVSAGAAVFIDNITSPLTPSYTYVEWEDTVVEVVDRATRPVSIIALGDDGVFYDVGAQTNEFFRDNLQIGIAAHPAGDVVLAISGPTVTLQNNALDVFDLSRAIGLINISGNVYSGSSTSLNKSWGEFYAYKQNGHTNKLNPSIVTVGQGTGISFIYMWRDGSGGWLYETTNTINFANYDNNSVDAVYPPNGSVTTSKWSIQHIYLARDGLTYIQFGQATYDSLSAAEDAVRSQAVEYNTIITADNLLRGYLITRGGGSNLASLADAKFIEAGKFGGGTSSKSTTSTTNLQQAYKNSSNPEIEIDAISGELSIKASNSDDTLVIFETLNNAGTTKFSIRGDGRLVLSLETYADDATAGAAGLTTGNPYQTATGEMRIKL